MYHNFSYDEFSGEFDFSDWVFVGDTLVSDEKLAEVFKSAVGATMRDWGASSCVLEIDLPDEECQVPNACFTFSMCTQAGDGPFGDIDPPTWSVSFERFAASTHRWDSDKRHFCAKELRRLADMIEAGRPRTSQDMTLDERKDLLRTDPDEFFRLFPDARNATP